MPSSFESKLDYIKAYFMPSLEYIFFAFLIYLANKTSPNKVNIKNYSLTLFSLLLIITFFKLGKNNDFYLRSLMMYYMFFAIFILNYSDKIYKSLKFKHIPIFILLLLQNYNLLFLATAISWPIFTGNFFNGSPMKKISYNNDPNIISTLKHTYSDEESLQYLSKNKWILKNLLR